ncbi:MAG: LysM peptidoglycan-binding domain-containing protein [Ilumatobacteraceae bacterium]
MTALEKATITNTVSRQRIPVLFNPEEYSLKRDIGYSSAAVFGQSAPILQFVSGNQQTLDMELLLDTYEEHREGGRTVARGGTDVRRLTEKITDLMNIDPTTHAPPVLLFAWASLTFTCVLSRVTQQFIMFLPDGTPVRARLSVTFSEYRNPDLEAEQVKRETADYTKQHVVGQGETLSSISAATYGDPALWRAIAARNGIDNPAAIETGATLVVPSLPYVDPDTGQELG